MTGRSKKLDARLMACAELFYQAQCGADIGADHGLLSQYLLEHNPQMRMVVSDISPMALSRAKQLLTTHQLEDRCHIVCADGLQALQSAPFAVECICIAGMGGETVRDILRHSESFLGQANLVISCHTDIPLVRRTLMEIHYRITEERLIRVHNRFYIVIRAEEGKADYDEDALLLGPCLMQNPCPLYEEYLLWRLRVTSAGRNEQARRDVQRISRCLNALYKNGSVL